MVLITGETAWGKLTSYFHSNRSQSSDSFLHFHSPANQLNCHNCHFSKVFTGFSKSFSYHSPVRLLTFINHNMTVTRFCYVSSQPSQILFLVGINNFYLMSHQNIFSVTDNIFDDPESAHMTAVSLILSSCLLMTNADCFTVTL